MGKVHVLATTCLALAVSTLIAGAGTPVPGEDQTSTTPGVEPYAGEMRYLADAARFTECSSGDSYPIAMEGAYLELERAYTAAVSEPGAPLYVTLEGAIEPRPRMEGEGDQPTVVVSRFIRAWPDESCDRARADASLTNTYWRIVRLGGTEVAAAEGQREPHVVLRSGDEGPTYAATVGCNSLGGGLTVDGHALAFGPAAATMMACPPPLDELERQLDAALAAARSWRILGNTLELFDASGAPVVLLEAVYL